MFNEKLKNYSFENYNFLTDYQADECIYPALVTPTGLTAVSKTFQILYKNEEVILADPFIFRLNMLVDSNKVCLYIYIAEVNDIVMN